MAPVRPPASGRRRGRWHEAAGPPLMKLPPLSPEQSEQLLAKAQVQYRGSWKKRLAQSGRPAERDHQQRQLLRTAICTDEKGWIQIFNVGAERMLGYTACVCPTRSRPPDISDPQEMVARAKALSLELATPIPLLPGFEGPGFSRPRAESRTSTRLTYIRKDGTRFRTVVSGHRVAGRVAPDHWLSSSSAPTTPRASKSRRGAGSSINACATSPSRKSSRPSSCVRSAWRASEPSPAASPNRFLNNVLAPIMMSIELLKLDSVPGTRRAKLPRHHLRQLPPGS